MHLNLTWLTLGCRGWSPTIGIERKTIQEDKSNTKVVSCSELPYWKKSSSLRNTSFWAQNLSLPITSSSQLDEPSGLLFTKWNWSQENQQSNLTHQWVTSSRYSLYYNAGCIWDCSTNMHTERSSDYIFKRHNTYIFTIFQGHAQKFQEIINVSGGHGMKADSHSHCKFPSY